MRIRTASLTRYRDLRRRVQTLEALYEDRTALDRIIESGRFIKLAVAIAHAYQQIETEFGATRPDGAERGRGDAGVG